MLAQVEADSLILIADSEAHQRINDLEQDNRADECQRHTRKYRDRLGYVHMKDWTKGKFCLMGRGTVGLDFGRIRETLNQIGYQGWVTGELSTYADTDADDSCHANREYLRTAGY